MRYGARDPLSSPAALSPTGPATGADAPVSSPGGRSGCGAAARLGRATRAAPGGLCGRADHRSVTREDCPGAGADVGPRTRTRLGRDRVPVMRRPPGPWGHGRGASGCLRRRAVVRRPGAGAGPAGQLTAAPPGGPRRADGAGVSPGPPPRGLPAGRALGAELGVPAATVRGWLRRLRPAPATAPGATVALGVIPRAVTGPASPRRPSGDALAAVIAAHGPRSPPWLRRGGPRRPPRPLRHRRRPHAGTRQLTARPVPGIPMPSPAAAPPDIRRPAPRHRHHEHTTTPRAHHPRKPESAHPVLIYSDATTLILSVPTDASREPISAQE